MWESPSDFQGLWRGGKPAFGFPWHPWSGIPRPPPGVLFLLGVEADEQPLLGSPHPLCCFQISMIAELSGQAVFCDVARGHRDVFV